MMNLRVILADDHPFVLIGVRAALELHDGMTIVGEATAPRSLIELLRTTPCDVLVTDLTMPEPGARAEDGLRLMRRIRHDWPAVRVIVLTSLTNVGILRSVMADGVSGVLNKTESMEALAAAVRAAGMGRPYISKSIRDTLAQAGTHASGLSANSNFKI